MAITLNQPQRIAYQQYYFSWSSSLTNPTYYIYKDLDLIRTTTTVGITIQFEDSESAIINIFDDAVSQPDSDLSSRVKMGWYDVPETDYYLIYKLVSSAWVEQQRQDDTGQDYFYYTSPFLPDCEWVRFKVEPVGTNGNEGLGSYVAEYIVRNPDVPNQNFVYSESTGKVMVNG